MTRACFEAWRWAVRVGTSAADGDDGVGAFD
jgi:hypothetical protein